MKQIGQPRTEIEPLIQNPTMKLKPNTSDIFQIQWQSEIFGWDIVEKRGGASARERRRVQWKGKKRKKNDFWGVDIDGTLWFQLMRPIHIILEGLLNFMLFGRIDNIVYWSLSL